MLRDMAEDTVRLSERSWADWRLRCISANPLTSDPEPVVEMEAFASWLLAAVGKCSLTFVVLEIVGEIWNVVVGIRWHGPCEGRMGKVAKEPVLRGAAKACTAFAKQTARSRPV